MQIEITGMTAEQEYAQLPALAKRAVQQRLDEIAHQMHDQWGASQAASRLGISTQMLHRRRTRHIDPNVPRVRMQSLKRSTREYLHRLCDGDHPRLTAKLSSAPVEVTRQDIRALYEVLEEYGSGVEVAYHDACLSLHLTRQTLDREESSVEVLKQIKQIGLSRYLEDGGSKLGALRALGGDHPADDLRDEENISWDRLHAAAREHGIRNGGLPT